MKVGLLALIGLATVLTGCMKSAPEVNNKAKSAKSAVLDYKHMVYIPVRNDETNGQIGALFQDIDTWIEKNPDKEVISVAMVNATQESAMGGYSHTTISGALIVFKRK